MRLSHLLAGLPATIRSSAALPTADPDITSVTDDSRKAKPGCLFLARPGASGDGRAFIADALAKGAVAVLGDEACELPAGSVAALATTSEPVRATALVADRFHGEPTAKLRVVGVTGTNGKTTIAYLTQQLLRRGGKPCGLLGTVETDDGATRTPSNLTTPGALELSALFARMVANGCTHAAMEVSSHALDQGRALSVRFACGIFTNLTGDHLDYHKTMEAYATAKAKLFASLDASAHAVVNVDDPWSKEMLRGKATALRCSLRDPKADCLASIEGVELDGMRLRVRGPWGDQRLRVPLVGQHNAMNALEAMAAAWTQGVSPADLAAGLEHCEAPPGRLQPVLPNQHGFSVLVDYAHTDDALLNVLTALRPVVPSGGRLMVVFGCGGDRDRTKRPRMAKVACDHADRVVVTSDNPRTERPEAIVEEIRAGVPQGTKAEVHVEVDRARAIAWAVGEARRGDLVLIAGKGHEDYQIVGTEKRPFDDRLHAKAAIEARGERRVPQGAGR